MRLYVAVTDKDWFALHASKSEVEEVNFWRPSPDVTFKALQPGELLLFKLHSPDNFIAGGGFFTRFLQLPVNLVWDTFGEANGVRSQSEMRERIAYYRRSPIAATEILRSAASCWLNRSFGIGKIGYLPRPTSSSTRSLAKVTIQKLEQERSFGTRYRLN